MSYNTSAPTFASGEVVTAAKMNALADGIQAAWTAWTPTVTAATGTFTTVSGAGRYHRVGKTIIFSCGITITTVGSASGEVRFTLPVTAQASSGHLGSGRENTSTGFMLQVRLTNTTVATVVDYANASPIGAGRLLLLEGTYEAA